MLPYLYSDNYYSGSNSGSGNYVSNPGYKGSSSAFISKDGEVAVFNDATGKNMVIYSVSGKQITSTLGGPQFKSGYMEYKSNDGHVVEFYLKGNMGWESELIIKTPNGARYFFIYSSELTARTNSQNQSPAPQTAQSSNTQQSASNNRQRIGCGYCQRDIILTGSGVQGTGRCPFCNNLGLNKDGRKCTDCGGTNKCRMCHGTGWSS